MTTEAVVLPPPLPSAPAEDLHRVDHGKVIPNLVAAGLMLLLGVWLFVSDLFAAGDMLFHGALALPVLGLFVGLFSLVAHYLAIVPVRFLVGANLAILLRAAFGYPLNLFMANTPASIVASGLFVMFAAWYLVSTMRGDCRIMQRPWFRWRHLCLTGGILVVLLVVSVPYLIGGHVRALQNLIGDYLRIDPRGISLVERVLEKDGHRIHLIGMMHIGQRDYYEKLKARIAKKPKGTRIILQEGVKDREKILPTSFASGKLYSQVAKRLGLEMQGRLDTGGSAAALEDEEERKAVWEELGVRFHNADMDVSDLDAQHRKFLAEMFAVIDAASLDEMFLISSQISITASDMEDLLMRGLIGRRNEILMQHFEAVGVHYDEVYIPWGAAHLKDIEKRMLELGYVEVDEKIRRVVEFW